MVTMEQVKSLINGLHLAIKKDEPELLIETVNTLDGKMLNPLYRAFIGYGNLSYSDVYMCMRLSAELLHKYYGKEPKDNVSSEAYWSELATETDNALVEAGDNQFLDCYLRNILLCIVQIIEDSNTREG